MIGLIHQPMMCRCKRDNWQVTIITKITDIWCIQTSFSTEASLNISIASWMME